MDTSDGVIVTSSYTAKNEKELTICEHDLINNIKKVDEDWCEGSLCGKRGMFPVKCIKSLDSEKQSSVYDPGKQKMPKGEKKRGRAKAVFSYTPANDDELELEVGDIIEVLEEEFEEGWSMGVLNGKKGVFPSNFVKKNNENGDDNTDGLKTHAESNGVIKDSHSGSNSSPDDGSEVKRKSIKGMGFGNIFQDGAIKLKNTSDRSPDAKGMRVISPTNLSQDDAPQLPPKPARELAKVKFSYDAVNEDELSLNEGDIITILSKEVEDEGWWKGELNGKIGVFPDNFVTIITPVEELKQSKPNRPDLPPPPKANKSSEPVCVGRQEEAKIKDDSSISKSVPPSSSKKPHLPPPMKKPQRSLKGLLGGERSANKSNPVTSNGVQELLTDDMKVKSQEDKSNKDNFDEIETNGDKLKHLTANRAKAPIRRPPSQFMVKENEQANGIAEEPNEPNWIKELKKQKAKRLNHHTNQDGDNASKEMPSKPTPPNKPPTPNKEKPKVESNKRLSCSEPAVESPSKSPILVKKHGANEGDIHSSPTKFANNVSKKDRSSKVDIYENCTPVASVKESPSATAEKEMIKTLLKQIEELKQNVVSKKEFMELKEQLMTLQDSVEHQKSKQNKRILELMTELDDEKKLRMSMQVEVDRVMKLAMS